MYLGVSQVCPEVADMCETAVVESAATQGMTRFDADAGAIRVSALGQSAADGSQPPVAAAATQWMSRFYAGPGAIRVWVAGQ